jgi:CheY-like chemotaxis protein
VLALDLAAGRQHKMVQQVLDPKAKVTDSVPACEEASGTSMEIDTRPFQILLAEDSAADVGIVRIALRDQGLNHVLHVASDGEEAISLIEKADNDRNASGPDLLLLDMHLPKYNGEEILKCLGSTERYAQIPVVVMTSSDAPADHELAQKHAALFYFRKPSSLDEFVQLGVIVRDILMGIKPLAVGVPESIDVAESKGGAA